jgi:hypothetical protein
MRLPRLASPTPRRLGFAALLAAVFAAGWFLGQPVRPHACEPHAPVYSDHFESVECPATDSRPRALAWSTGDFR